MDEIIKSTLVFSKKFLFLLPIRNFDSNKEFELNMFITSILHNLDLEILILDKTNNNYLIHFLNKKFSKATTLKILKRPHNESTFDSQKLIKLNKNSWILQLHEDDYLEDFNDLFKLKIKQNDTILLNVLNQFYEPLSDTNPNRYIFSLIPSNIWNLFVDYLRLQNSHISYSVDLILSDLVKSFTEKFYFSEAKYIYTDRWNFSKYFNLKRHVINLTRLDGWDFLSNRYVFIFNARIEFLIYIKYFHENIINNPYHGKLDVILSQLRNTYRFKIFWKLMYHFSNFCNKIRLLNDLVFIKKIFFTSQIVYKSFSFNELPDLLDLVRTLKKIPNLKSLSNRFDFWIKNLSN